jgi:hypothetical protein
MATGTGNLPNPGQDAVPFTTLTAEFYDNTIENIESLATGTGIGDGAIPVSKLNLTNLWGEELTRITVGAAGTTFTSSTFAAKTHLTLLVWTRATLGTVNIAFRFNGDSANNYARKSSADFGAASSSASESLTQLSGSGTTPQFGIVQILNMASFEKQILADVNDAAGAGAATVPISRNTKAKWTNTTTQITTLTLLTSGTGQFNVGTEVIVLGHN